MSWKGILRRAGLSVDSSGNLEISGALAAAGGIPLVGTVFGDAYFVDYRNGLDTGGTYTGRRRDKAFKTLSNAIDNVTTNNNDVIFVDGDSTVVETSMISLTKNRVHIVGVNGVPGLLGQGAKVSATITSGATNIATFQNTGVRNTISNIKFMNSSTVDEGLYAVAEGGEFTRYFNCEMYKDTDLNVTGAAELLMNGDSSQFYSCVIGSTVNAISGAIIRPCVLMSRTTIAGKVARDFVFEDCIFLRNCGNTANRFVYGANATDVERMGLFKKCLFWNTKLAADTPAQNVAFAASQTEGYVLLWDCASIGAATAMSTTTGVYVQGYTPDATGAAAGIAIQAA
jgi:hypothetical protein